MSRFSSLFRKEHNDVGKEKASDKRIKSEDNQGGQDSKKMLEIEPPKLTSEKLNLKVVPVVLSDLVDMFIEWYTENMVKGHYTDIGEYHIPNNMRNLVEKIAVWYELRYPDYVIHQIMPGSSYESTDVNECMFEKNAYAKQNLSIAKNFKWADFYNKEAFIAALPIEERMFFYPEYLHFVKMDWTFGTIYFRILPDGTVEDVSNLDKINHFIGTSFKVTDIVGKKLPELVDFFKSNNIPIYEDNELLKAIQRYKLEEFCRKQMLNSAMYRIIERGGSRTGPRRAFIFAKEFGLNIDIPMMYGVDTTDPGLKSFVYEYLKVGGSKNLICYDWYFVRKSKYQKVELISLTKIISSKPYEKSELEQYQKLVDVLAILLQKS